MFRLLIGFVIGATMAMAVAKGPCYLSLPDDKMSQSVPIEIPCPETQK